MNATAALRPGVTPDKAPGIVVTGTAQRQAWRLRVMPPVEALPDGVWSVPVAITGHPLRYTLCYVLESSRGPVLIDPGCRTTTPCGRRSPPPAGRPTCPVVYP